MSSQQRQFENSDMLCKYISEYNNGYCLMMFSAGIDSIAMFYQLKKYFKRIVPIYMYSIPDLEFVNRYLNYFEHKFNKKIIRIPHPKTVRLLEQNVYNDHHNLQNKFMRSYDMDTMIVYVTESLGISENLMLAIGNKMSDNPMRYMTLKKNGTVNYARSVFYPIFDWNDTQVRNTIKENDCKIPIDYKIFGRSYDGLVYRFSAPLKKYFPNDYKKLLEFFPLLDVELKRAEL